MTGHMIEPGSQYAKRQHSAEVGGGGDGLGFSEMVARAAHLPRKGDGTGKAKGELRGEIAAAVGARARAAGAATERRRREYVYPSTCTSRSR